MTTTDDLTPLRDLLLSLRQACLLDPAAPETPARARGLIVAAVDRALGLDTGAHRPNAATRRRRRARAGPMPPAS